MSANISASADEAPDFSSSLSTAKDRPISAMAPIRLKAAVIHSITRAAFTPPGISMAMPG